MASTNLLYNVRQYTTGMLRIRTMYGQKYLIVKPGMEKCTRKTKCARDFITGLEAVYRQAYHGMFCLRLKSFMDRYLQKYSEVWESVTMDGGMYGKILSK